mgnify:FL=1|jgi:PKHD-type hydroxylase|tara:strand:- start:217 stop:885 length:669 start_codon:yes stop_codon:yes gene_type:complete
MNFKNAYWYFSGILSERFCDELIQHGNSQREKIATIGSTSERIKKRHPKVKHDNIQKKLTKKDIQDLKKTRDSNVAFVNDRWIYDEITPYIHRANQNAGWNFDIDYFESCQFTKYKLKQFYDWHSDPFPEPYNKPDQPHFHGKQRKLSASVQLSDPKDYKGGDLEIQPRTEKDASIVLNTTRHFGARGSIIVFPSHLWHRVKPVTKGIRYSLVLWALGYPFR